MSRVGIEFWFLDDLGVQRASTLDCSVEIGDFEPQQDSMSDWRRVRVDEIRVILLVPRMELQDQATVDQQPIVAIAMLMFRQSFDSEQLLVPTAAYPHIAHGNQRLGLNACFLNFWFCHLLITEGVLRRRRAAMTATATKNIQNNTAPIPKAIRPITELPRGEVPTGVLMVNSRGPEPIDIQEKSAPMVPTIPRTNSCCVTYNHSGASAGRLPLPSARPTA